MKEQGLHQKVEELEKRLQLNINSEQEKIFEGLEQKLKLNNQKQLLSEVFGLEMQQLEQRLVKLIRAKSDSHEAKLSEVGHMLGMRRTFEMKDFSGERLKDIPNDWQSPPMYTHMCGYKFCVGVDANGFGVGRGKSIYVTFWAMLGEYDSQLNWPARARLSIELINQRGRENAVYTYNRLNWKKPTEEYHRVTGLVRIPTLSVLAFLEHVNLRDFLVNDTLCFHINIELY